MECPRMTASNKRIGVESSRDCSFIYYQEHEQNLCSLENGQHHRSILCEQNGGGGRSSTLTKIAKNIWEFCLGREITFTAEHLTGLPNQTADWERRKVIETSSNSWKLNNQIFSQIN